MPPLPYTYTPIGCQVPKLLEKDSINTCHKKLDCSSELNPLIILKKTRAAFQE